MQQQHEFISVTVAALIATASEARRVAAALQRHQSGIADPHKRAICHRLALVAREFGQAIVQAEAALTPQTRSAIALAS